MTRITLKKKRNAEGVALKTFEISADVEILNNAMQYTDDIKPLLSKVETKEFKIESFEKAEEAVVLFIESQFGKSFNKNNVEASPDLSSSIIYHFSSGDFMFQLFIDVKHEGKKVVFPDYYPANVVTEFKLDTGDKTYYAKEYKAGEFGIYNKEDNRLYADCFESVEQAQEWYNAEVKHNEKLKVLNDAIFEDIENAIESLKKEDDEVPCIYCKENPSNHFLCESCGAGMCDECYDSDREHTQHYNKPLEECEDIHIDAIKKVCNSEEPDYICEACMKKALSLKPQDFADEANKILSTTSLTAIIIETSELYGEDGDYVHEGDPFYMQPMYEGYMQDDLENEIDDTRTGRYCSLKSVSDELESFATDSKISFIKGNIESLVGTRWENKEDLQNHLDKIYSIKSQLKKVDSSKLVRDYALIGTVADTTGYMDIYYLKVPFGNKRIYITEVSVSDE